MSTISLREPYSPQKKIAIITTCLCLQLIQNTGNWLAYHYDIFSVLVEKCNFNSLIESTYAGFQRKFINLTGSQSFGLVLNAPLPIETLSKWLKNRWLYTSLWPVMQWVNLVYTSPIFCFQYFKMDTITFNISLIRFC